MKNITNWLSNTDLTTVLESPISIAIISIAIFLCLLKVAHILFNRFTKDILSKTEDTEHVKQIQTFAHIVKSTADIVFFLIFAMVLLTKLGIDIRPILTAAGVLGVAVGFGAKRFVEDIISGMIILLEGQIRVGDVVEITDKVGVVEKINLKMVVLRDLHGRVHYVRNGMIDIVTNLTRDFSYYVLELGVAYKENVDKVIQTLEKIYEEELMTNCKIAEQILEPIEILGVDSFGESSVNIKLRIKTKPMSQWTVGREFNRLIKNKFDELNIEIPYPHTTLYFANTPTEL